MPTALPRFHPAWTDPSTTLDGFALIDFPPSQAQIWGEGELSDVDPFSPDLATSPGDLTIHGIDAALTESLFAAVAHCTQIRTVICLYASLMDDVVVDTKSLHNLLASNDNALRAVNAEAETLFIAAIRYVNSAAVVEGIPCN